MWRTALFSRLLEVLFHSNFFSVVCSGEVSLSKISQFQNMAKIYHIEHKELQYFHRDISLI